MPTAASSSSSSPHGVGPLKRASLLSPQKAAGAATCISTSSCCSGCLAGGTTTATTTSGRGKHNDTVFCASCVGRMLQSARQRRRQVVEEHAALQRACREKFANLQDNSDIHIDNCNEAVDACHRLLRMQQEEWQDIWLPRWESLRRTSSHVAVQVARKRLENEQRSESLQSLARQNEGRRQLLYRWKRALLQLQSSSLAVPPSDEESSEAATAAFNQQKEDGGGVGGSNVVVQVNRSENALGAMAMAVMEARQQVRRLRFQWALYAFQLHKLHVGDDHHANKSNATTSSRDSAAVCRGIGKIGGCLPLPHAGPELYVFLPPPELQSALRLVASLTSMVAACLGILLPHPILLQQQQTSSSLQHADSTSPTGGGGYFVNGATRKTSFEYCRDLAMRGVAAAAEQPNANDIENWQEQQAFQNAASAVTTAAVATNNAATKAAPTLSTSYLVSLAGQTFRRATGVVGGGGTPNSAAGASRMTATTSTVPPSRTVASSSSKNDTSIATAATTNTRKQQEAVGSSHHKYDTILSMDPTSVERRIHHATAAVLAENEHGSLYTLAAPGTVISSSSSPSSTKTADEISSSDDSGSKTSNNSKANQPNEHHQHRKNATVVDADHFAIALQLLQNDIICLCIRAGVPVTNLWPAQAVLLNLQALQEFCQEQTTTSLGPHNLVHRR